MKWEQELVLSNMEWGQWWFEMGTGVRVTWSGDNGGLKWEQELVMSNME